MRSYLTSFLQRPNGFMKYPSIILTIFILLAIKLAIRQFVPQTDMQNCHYYPMNIFSETSANDATILLFLNKKFHLIYFSSALLIFRICHETVWNVNEHYTIKCQNGNKRCIMFYERFAESTEVTPLSDIPYKAN